MIHDVDESLRALLRRDALNGSDVEVVLDAPNKEWAARRNAPTLDLYLYDIREAVAERQAGTIELRGDDGFITGRTPFPRKFKLSYLVTAWTQRPEDEHRLLSAALACFLRYDALPPDLLAGALTGVGEPVPVRVALPPPEDRSLSDVWSAMGGELKPSLDVVVVAPFAAGMVEVAGAPVREEPKFHFESPEGQTEDRRGRPQDDEPDEAAAVETRPDETVTGGTEEQAGRIVRVRAVR